MIATTIKQGVIISVEEVPLTFHINQQTLLEIDNIMEEVMNDPKVAEQAEEDQRKYGTLTSEELREQFTI